MRITALLPLFALLAGLATTPAMHAQEAPTAARAVEAFQAKMVELEAGGKITWEQVSAAARESMAGLEVGALELADIELLHAAQLIRYAEAEAEFSARLTQFAARPDADGASAAVLLLALDPGEDEALRRELIGAALRHEGLPGALAQGRAGSIFGSLGELPEPLLIEHFDDVVGLSSFMTAELPAPVVGALPGLLEGLLELEGQRHAGGCEVLRENMVRATEGALARTGDPEIAGMLTDRLRFLNGAYARRELVGCIAPRLEFTWTSADGALRTLEDLRGKVVVLDFWATWCGPCVASFPRVRELTERYSGHSVAVVGVTSLQGSHIRPDGTRVDTEDDPKLEYELMQAYLGKMDITWTVAFSRQDVFNPEYGIRGIPHVVILDADGRVRHRGLHPMEPGKEAKIDALLREAGLSAPVSAREAGASRED